MTRRRIKRRKKTMRRTKRKEVNILNFKILDSCYRPDLDPHTFPLDPDPGIYADPDPILLSS